jgi:tRNA nucleotidyltransferase (CCA-adding enzyme)
VSPELILSRIRESAVRTPPAVLEVLKRLHAAGYEAFLAGGCVRDMLLGRVPDDYDVTTSAVPEAVMKQFARVIPTGIQHGTVTVLTGRTALDKVEVTTYRGEGEYLDGRRPERVEFITELERDLARRDFTINAMALNPTALDLRDPFDGLRDLEAGIVRAVGDPRARFSEDGLRTVRAVRFASVLSFALDPATLQAIPLALETFRKVALERVRDELNKLLLRSPEPSIGLALLSVTGLQGEIVPELHAMHEHDRAHTLRAVDQAPARLEVRLSAWLQHAAPARQRPGEAAMQVLERLKYPRKVTDAVGLIVRELPWLHDPSSGDAPVRRYLARIGIERIDDVLDLRLANVRATVPPNAATLANEEDLRGRIDAARQRRVPLSMQDLAIGGADVMAMSARGPGAYVGATLRTLMEHVLDHPDDNSRPVLEGIARRLLSPPQ